MFNPSTITFSINTFVHFSHWIPPRAMFATVPFLIVRPSTLCRQYPDCSKRCYFTCEAKILHVECYIFRDNPYGLSIAAWTPINIAFKKIGAWGIDDDALRRYFGNGMCFGCLMGWGGGTA